MTAKESSHMELSFSESIDMLSLNKTQCNTFCLVASGYFDFFCCRSKGSLNPECSDWLCRMLRVEKLQNIVYLTMLENGIWRVTRPNGRGNKAWTQ